MAKVLGLASYKVLPAITGGQKVITLFHKYLSREVSFTCITTRDNDPQAAEGYEVLNTISTSFVRYMNPFYFFTIRKLIRQKGVTHLLLSQPFYGWLGVLLKWFTGVKLAIQSHNIEGERFRSMGKRWWWLLLQYERWVHRHTDYNFFMQDDDHAYALRHFKLQPRKCTTVTYGIEWKTPPSPAEKQKAREMLLAQHNIPAHHHLLLFNGTFSYLPNLNGLQYIIQLINPILQATPGFSYTILIAGKGIPETITAGQHPNIIFAGFVHDIAPYFIGSDVFLNTTIEGGGIKTKLVEALGHNMNAVSSHNGALGVDPAICNGKLVITPDDFTGFAEAVVRSATYQATIPEAYFDYFSWENIARKAVKFMSS